MMTEMDMKSEGLRGSKRVSHKLFLESLQELESQEPLKANNALPSN